MGDYKGTIGGEHTHNGIEGVERISDIDVVLKAYEQTDFEKSVDRLSFVLHGVVPGDLPDRLFEVGSGNYPMEGFDHEAHHAATVAMRALQAEFNWAEQVDGVSMKFPARY